MRQFCFGMVLILLAGAARAEDAADQPYLVLQCGGHTAPINKVLFTPDGKEVVTVSDDKTVRCWDPATGERLAVYYLPAGLGDQGALRAAVLSPDGKTLAVGGETYRVDGKPVSHIYLLDLTEGRVAAALPGSNPVRSLAFSHDGKVLAAGAWANARVLDAASGRLLHVFKGPSLENTWIVDVAFSPDDKLLAVATQNGNAGLWSVETGEEACPPMKHKDGLTGVLWKDDDALFTAGYAATFVTLWDRRGKLLRHFDPPPGRKEARFQSLSFLPGPTREELFYAWNWDKSGAAVLNLAKPEKSRDGPSWPFRAESYGAVSPDGRLAAVSDGFDVYLWTVKDGKTVRRLTGRGQSATGVGWRPDGRGVGWTYDFKPDLQRAFDLGELRFAPKPDAKYVRAAHSAKSRALGDLRVDMPNNYTVKVLSNNKPGLLATIKTDHQCGADGYTFLPGDRLALAFHDHLVVYNAGNGKPIRNLDSPTEMIWDLAPSPDGRYLLAACNDKTLRIYDPDKPAPLLSLFVAGADWVAWTQEGYYAASPAGEKLMGWQVNNGLEQLGTFYPAAEFHKAFYRPDVIRRVLKEGSVEKALAAADKENGTTTETLDLARALPPEVHILAPAEGASGKEVEVKAEAVGRDRPVVALNLLLDGRPCPGAEVKRFVGPKTSDNKEAKWTIMLPEGEHRLSVLAESDVSFAASKEVTLTYRPAAPSESPTLYVLAVGINAYPGSLKLNWAVDDAAEIQKAFQAGGAPKPYGKVEAKLLLDKDASKEGIVAGLDWLKQKMTADDTAVVFYAGHGHRDKKTGQFYLLPQDVDVTAVDKTGVTGTMLKDKLKAVPGRVLVLLDACHSGSIGQSPADPASLTDDVQRQLAAPDCGVVVMCAAMAQEEAGEAAAVQHGFFTAALLSGLGGKAPSGRDGLIHLTALNFYVEEEVAALSKDEQHVVVDRPSTVTSFPLVKAPAKSDEK